MFDQFALMNLDNFSVSPLAIDDASQSAGPILDILQEQSNSSSGYSSPDLDDQDVFYFGEKEVFVYDQEYIHNQY